MRLAEVLKAPIVHALGGKEHVGGNKRGLMQETLSHAGGVTQSHLSEIEAGRRNASIDLIGAIALALGVSVASLLAERPDEA